MKLLLTALIAITLVFPAPLCAQWFPVFSGVYTITVGPTTFVDNFNRTSTGVSNPASDGAGTWATMNGYSAPDLTGSDVAGVSNGISYGIRAASPSFTANQSATITVNETTGYWGVLVRIQGASDSRCYSFTLDGTAGTAKLSKVTAADGSTSSQIGSLITITGGSGSSGVIGGGDSMTLEVSGTTLTCKVNGTTERTDTDSDYSTGQPGISIYAIRYISAFSATTL